MRVLLPWAVLLLVLGGPARAERVDSIPRPPRGTWSVDTTRRFQPVTLARVDRIGSEVDRSGEGQIAVVMVSTTDGMDPRAFATELFNTWGIGHAGQDDGALLLVALDDRAAEIVLGDGVDGRAELNMSDAVMQSRIVPAFKRGDPDGAVLAGAEGLRTLLANAKRGVPFDSGSTGAARSGLSGSFDVTQAPMWLLGSGLGALGLAGAGLRRWLRRRPRVCEGCEQPRVLLDEVADDKYLSRGQQREESLGSVDYDVWWCQRCRHARVERYGAWFAAHEKCRSCGYKTARSESCTRVEATYEHGGVVDVTVSCEHCGHRHEFTRHTARLTRSSSSSSSSSGGSFGGGSSSGSGSSGRW